MKSINCLACSNTNCFVKRFSSEDIIVELNSRKTQSRYKRGQHIIAEGAPVQGAYFIYNGKVKVVTEGYMGREHIVRLASDGYVVGHVGTKSETYPIGAVALDESVVCFIDNDSLYNAFLKNPELTFQIMIYYAEELRRAEKRLKYLSQMTVREKVAEALLYLIDVFGFTKGSNEVNVRLSRGELASLSGTNADQVSRMITDLKQSKLISTKGKSIFVEDYGKLKDLIIGYDPYG